MMGYTLSEDEIAIVIRPQNYEEDWNGDVSIELSASNDSPVPEMVMAHIMNIATMMSAFLDVASEHPDIYDLVEEHRNRLMGVDEEEEEELKVTREGNVYTLNAWTKTEGSA
jgi:hypothetical protein|tara:strand:+ start:198 stop:533 length:336 start_codon:yes stop_codon:yes gene_type:complete